MKGIFISGTDTDVGKTITSAALVTCAQRMDLVPHYHKPIQTNIEHDSDARTVSMLVHGASSTMCTQGLGLRRPLSPHAAAHMAGCAIDFASVISSTKISCGENFSVVEGAGGIMVPITNRMMMIDLMVALALPVVLVARSTLGTINHTLLSLAALRARRIIVGGVVMVGEKNISNAESIKFYGDVKNLVCIPPLNVVNQENIHRLVENSFDDLKSFLQNATESASAKQYS